MIGSVSGQLSRGGFSGNSCTKTHLDGLGACQCNDRLKEFQVLDGGISEEEDMGVWRGVVEGQTQC